MTEDTPTASLELSKVLICGYVTCAIDARALHSALAVTDNFLDWIKVRIASYNFLENQDFIVRSGPAPVGATELRLDYLISIDMAKHLAILEQTPARKDVREFLFRAEQQTLSWALSSHRPTFDRDRDEIDEIKLNEAVRKALPPFLSYFLADKRVQLRYGKTAGQIMRDHKFPQVRLDPWFGNQLAKAGCLVEGGGYGQLGNSRARLFDPDKANAWLKARGNSIVKMKIAERLGQQSFDFKFPKREAS